MTYRFSHVKILIGLCPKQCCGSMTFWCGSGSADPCLWLMDPDSDPSIFIIDLQDANKNKFKKKSFSAYYFLRLLLHHFSKIKSKKKSQNSRNPGFSWYFCLMMEGSGSGSTSHKRIRIQEAQKHVDPVDRIRIGPDPQHWSKELVRWAFYVVYFRWHGDSNRKISNHFKKF